jgi:DNA invertase Pin-like site-specific DNA recombinase
VVAITVISVVVLGVNQCGSGEIADANAGEPESRRDLGDDCPYPRAHEHSRGRVSTTDQTTANQELELREVVERAGWKVTKVYRDHGISGANGRDKRPAFDALHRAAARREFDIVMAWSVDRLGRSLKDLVNFLEELRALNVDLFLQTQGIDTTSPSGKAMFGMLSVFADFERSIIQERVRAGLARAKGEGKVLGRPKIAPDIENAVRTTLANGIGMLKTARLHGVGVRNGTAHRPSDVNDLCRLRLVRDARQPCPACGPRCPIYVH